MKSFFSKYSTAISIIFGWYIVLAVSINLAVTKQQMDKSFKPGVLDFLSLFKAHHVESLLIILFCYILIKKVISLLTSKPSTGWKTWFLYSVPALLLSSFMIAGYSFKTTGFATCITFSKYQFFKSLFAGGGYFVLFLCLIILLFEKLDELTMFVSEPGSTESRWNCFYNHPFIISYLLLLIFSIPYIIISYPGIFMGDTIGQILQGYNIWFDTNNNQPILLDLLYNHHPILHTLLLHYFIVLGNLIHSYNFGIFLFAFFQLNLFIAVISFSIMVLLKHFYLKLKFTLLILLYFLVHPFVQNYMMLITKDVLFAVFFLLFLLFGCLFLEGKILSTKHYLIWIISMLGMILFRNEGIYILVPSLLYWRCLNVSKKQISSLLAIIVCFFLVWHRVVFPFFNIAEGSIREMLSIPFQQTARYVKYRPQKVTPDEELAIDAVLDYKKIGKNYDPNVSDPVKDTFKERSTKEQRLRYFKTWIRMFFKEPKLYIETVIANKFGYFYPEAKLAFIYSYDWSEHCMKSTNNNEYIPFEFHHLKELEEYRKIYDRFMIEVSAIPIINVLCSASTYVWMLILLISYTLKQGNKREFALLVPFIMYFLVLMAGPMNGTYYRYVYPYAITFPFLFIFIIYLRDINRLDGKP